MDGRGGCCVGIARYGGGFYHDTSKVDRIMLRFRPIAPKPAVGGSDHGSSSSEKADLHVKSGRGKRRYVRDNNKTVNSKRCNRKRKDSPEETVVTLPLLPEAPERKSPVENHDRTVLTKEAWNVPMWLSFDGNYKAGNGLDRFSGLSDRKVMVSPDVKVVDSCVIVECVTDTWVDGVGLGETDAERMTTLGRDTCPGFVSDDLCRVTWTNGAYRRMVEQGSVAADHEGDHDHRELRLYLVMKDESVIKRLNYPAFSCRVRLVQNYTCGKERSSLTLPCDVWRMDGGGFAWRLDVKAALSLGR